MEQRRRDWWWGEGKGGIRNKDEAWEGGGGREENEAREGERQNMKGGREEKEAGELKREGE